MNEWLNYIFEIMISTLHFVKGAKENIRFSRVGNNCEWHNNG